MTIANSFEDRYARICAITQTSRECDLARILGIRAPSVGGARKRRLIPLAWVERLALRYNVSADWILFGRGSRTPASGFEPEEAAQGRPEQNGPEQDGSAQERAAMERAAMEGQALTVSGKQAVASGAVPSGAQQTSGLAAMDETVQLLAKELQDGREERRRLARENHSLREEREELNQALDKAEEQLERLEADLETLRQEWEQAKERERAVMQQQASAPACAVVQKPEPAPGCEIVTTVCEEEWHPGEPMFFFRISWGWERRKKK